MRGVVLAELREWRVSVGGRPGVIFFILVILLVGQGDLAISWAKASQVGVAAVRISVRGSADVAIMILLLTFLPPARSVPNWAGPACSWWGEPGGEGEVRRRG